MMLNLFKNFSESIKENEYRIRLFLSFVFSLLAFALLPNVVGTLEWAYYKYPPVDRFLSEGTMMAGDMCFGETKQRINSTRKVYGTNIGWQAEAYHEFYLINEDTEVKIEDRTTYPFIEKRDKELMQRNRVYVHDSVLAPGHYGYYVYLSIELPHNIVKEPIIYYSEFDVKDNCDIN